MGARRYVVCEGVFPDYECDREAIGVRVWSSRNIAPVCAEHWGDGPGIPLSYAPGVAVA